MHPWWLVPSSHTSTSSPPAHKGQQSPCNMGCSCLTCDLWQSVCLSRQLSSVAHRSITASVAMAASMAGHVRVHVGAISCRRRASGTQQCSDFRTSELLRSRNLVLSGEEGRPGSAHHKPAQLLALRAGLQWESHSMQ